MALDDVVDVAVAAELELAAAAGGDDDTAADDEDTAVEEAEAGDEEEEEEDDEEALLVTTAALLELELELDATEPVPATTVKALLATVCMVLAPPMDTLPMPPEPACADCPPADMGIEPAGHAHAQLQPPFAAACAAFSVDPPPEPAMTVKVGGAPFAAEEVFATA